MGEEADADWDAGLVEWGIESACESQYPELVTGVYFDFQGRKWFCIRRPSVMNCSSSGGHFTSMFLKTFKEWGWKLAEKQTY